MDVKGDEAHQPEGEPDDLDSIGQQVQNLFELNSLCDHIKWTSAPINDRQSSKLS